MVEGRVPKDQGLNQTRLPEEGGFLFVVRVYSAVQSAFSRPDHWATWKEAMTEEYNFSNSENQSAFGSQGKK